MFGCKCSEAQLHYVGCECDRFEVIVYPKGYADGEKRFIAATNDKNELRFEAARLYGPTALVAHVRDLNKLPTPCRPGEARAMRGDNS